MKISKARLVAPTSLALIAISLLSWTSPGAVAQNAGPLVLASNAVKSVMDDLRPKCEQAIGQPLKLRYDTSKTLGKAISAGEAFDVVILNPEIMDSVSKADKIVPGSRVDIARATFGVAVRSGAPKPDISTAAAMKQTLLQAKKITYPNEGASTPFILKMFDRLGIAEQLKPKSLPEVTTIPALNNVAEGRADLVITLTSEILPAKGLDFVGPVPEEFQGDLIFSAAISAKANNLPAAQALVKYLQSPAIAPTLKANGMEPVKNK